MVAAIGFTLLGEPVNLLKMTGIALVIAGERCDASQASSASVRQFWGRSMIPMYAVSPG
jgi:hypothetical protein